MAKASTAGSRRVTASTGIKPFNMSPNKVIIAAFFPPWRSTLVAPGLFEPTPRGSFSPINLQVIMAVEMEPSR